MEANPVRPADDSTNEETVFTIITSASEAMDFIDKCFKACIRGEYELCGHLLEQSDRVLDKAHEVQAQMIQDELNGKTAVLNMMMIHAQDHLMNVILAKQIITYFLELAEKIDTGRRK